MVVHPSNNPPKMSHRPTIHIPNRGHDIRQSEHEDEAPSGTLNQMKYNISNQKGLEHLISDANTIEASQAELKRQLSRPDKETKSIEEHHIDNLKHKATDAHNKAASIVSHIRDKVISEIPTSAAAASVLRIIPEKPQVLERTSSEKDISGYLVELNDIQTHMVLLAESRDSTTMKDLHDFYSRIYNETQEMAEWYSNYIQRIINQARSIMSPEKRRHRSMNSFDSKMTIHGLPGPNYEPSSSPKWGEAKHNHEMNTSQRRGQYRCDDEVDNEPAAKHQRYE